MEWIGIDEIYRAYVTSKSQEAEIYNNDGCPGTYKVSSACDIVVSVHHGSRINDNKLTNVTFYIPLKDIESILFTSEEYIRAVQNPFLELEKSRKERKPPAKVLDCFAGIGTLIVVLKRLEIDIAKVSEPLKELRTARFSFVT